MDPFATQKEPNATVHPSLYDPGIAPPKPTTISTHRDSLSQTHRISHQSFNRKHRDEPKHPPAYTNSNPMLASTLSHAQSIPPLTFTDSDLDSDADEEDNPPPVTIFMNASTSITGNSNIISTHPVDNLRLAAYLLQALRLPAAASVNVRVDCAVSVRGERNVIGAAGLGRSAAQTSSARSTANAATSSATAAGAANAAVGRGDHASGGSAPAAHDVAPDGLKRKADGEPGETRCAKGLKCKRDTDAV